MAWYGEEDTFEEVPVSPEEELEFLRGLRVENQKTLQMRDAQIHGLQEDITSLRSMLRNVRYARDTATIKYEALLEKVEGRKMPATCFGKAQGKRKPATKLAKGA